MASATKIEWCDATFNPFVGCTKISPACDHCYAESWAKRTGQPQLWQGQRRRTSEAYWRQPLKWDRDAEWAGVRRKVFCASLADVFDNKVPEEWREDLWTLIETTPHLDWLLLTKRPQNIRKLNPSWWGPLATPPRNVWLGTTVENQEEADRRIPHLLDVPSYVRFLSCEPLLGPVDLTRVIPPSLRRRDGFDPYFAYDTLRGHAIGPDDIGLAKIDWVIVGGESGPGRRPMDLQWARSLRDQCAASGVAYFMKQIDKKAPIPGDLMVREFPQ